ncbi:calcium/sodium antiporter [Gymnodinialimonas ceratoperidinii]|uniref:Calcium/sodium antiporter n=1 Tax=Gymnodinialimonas ceratoperidinii TaxID=2856823 RepID=A0A8F6TX77_9RHOB|nr:calcium/sodium antiporter [Gymnodinialimonas ceratoperidinii]QXT40325.1 calcium/sodium antiporter [Gymnodinialimonas ceratoperidinii]
MAEQFGYAILGLVILLLAGDVLVKGAVNLALRLGIPALIVSLTVVAFGTSAPELLISIQSILNGVPGLALGNVVGSNTANVLLVLGLPALMAGLAATSDTRREYTTMMIGTLVFIALCFFGPLVWWHGLVLLTGLALVLLDAMRKARAHRREANGDEDVLDELEEADPDMAGWQIGLYLVLGLVGLPLGASLLIDSASEIAIEYGISDAVIGLTLVAVGTSLPELATTVMAAFRRQADVAIGNVIGSNVFNLLAIIGVAVFVGPIPVDAEILSFDLWVMLAASVVLAPFVFFRWPMGRLVGLAFSALYAGYMVLLLV